jgi:hypothetical protein
LKDQVSQGHAPEAQEGQASQGLASVDLLVVQRDADVPYTNVPAFSTDHDAPNIYLFATHANYGKIHDI